jgi:hypothetical protein
MSGACGKTSANRLIAHCLLSFSVASEQSSRTALVAAIMAYWALQGAWQVIRHAVGELKTDPQSRAKPKTFTARMRRLFARPRAVRF